MIWPHKNFLDLVTDRTGGQPKIPRSAYEPAGEFPVIDQGKGEPSGFTSDSSLLFRGRTPLLLFGDHTREVKHVDGPFALGADGVKALEPSPGVVAKFLYYYLLHDPVQAHGYSRHFKFLKEKQVPLPHPREQQRIVELLDQADALRQKRREADEISKKILPALFQEMFGDIHTMGDRFAVGVFGDVLRSTKNGLYKHKDFYGTGTPILKMFNLYEGWLRLDRVDSVELEPRELDAYRLETGDILFNRVNTPELVGKCAVIDETARGAVFESKNIRAQLDQRRVSPYYASVYFNSEPGRQALTRKLKHAAGMATITGPDIREVSFPLPPFELQQKFDAACRSVRTQREHSTTSAATLETLFQTLLHRAFDGSLTAKWREAHAKELIQEMEHHSR